jgi:hypothetical protein
MLEPWPTRYALRRKPVGFHLHQLPAQLLRYFRIQGIGGQRPADSGVQFLSRLFQLADLAEQRPQISVPLHLAVLVKITHKFADVGCICRKVKRQHIRIGQPQSQKSPQV